jgi:hypothetical protein
MTQHDKKFNIKDIDECYCLTNLINKVEKIITKHKLLRLQKYLEFVKHIAYGKACEFSCIKNKERNMDCCFVYEETCGKINHKKRLTKVGFHIEDSINDLINNIKEECYDFKLLETIDFNFNFLIKQQSNNKYYVCRVDKVLVVENACINNDEMIGILSGLIINNYFSFIPQNLILNYDLLRIRPILKRLLDFKEVIFIFKFYHLNDPYNFKKYFTDGKTPYYKFIDKLNEVKIFTDQELEELFNSNKQIKKKNKQKKIKENNEIDTDDNSETIVDTEPLTDTETNSETNSETTVDTEPEPLTDTETNSETNSETTEQETHNNNSLITIDYFNNTYFKISFNYNVYFSFLQKTYLTALINKLYNSNNKFKSFMETNNYDYIRILKDIHNDLNGLCKSQHINICFYDSYNCIKSVVYHAYISTDDEIISLTKIVDELL